MLKKTTDLALIEIGYPFAYGEVIKIHKISDFSIVEAREADEEVMFYVYTNVNEALYRYKNLDEAIVVAIALKYDGNISEAGYFMNAIGAYDG